ncbi:phosphate/phosphite/phosphonate ABC transporter substrate-binding protein [Marimonas lutisalis]|uniref:phosphate/phosphite/phosphonate ABC transporter substrate-binding protein n=1 Tax=Marimonas lutisalis TaxID=2545756 RepID=UPI0010F86293|nr:PhnD/SsuA/transferrin family substrate-binding protein [Marimonas lutisalis]
MIAALPMYDRPETAAANDRLWQAIRAHLGHGPQALTRDMDVWDIWQNPDLLLAQTCGYPYRARLHGAVTLVGTPDYGLPGCPPGHYCSVFVARADDPVDTLDAFSGRRFAYNEALSQSGWAAPATHMAGLGLAPGPLIKTGAHRASARAVAEGRADFAALDAVTWTLIQAHDSFAANLREITRTRPTPGLPLITAKTRDPAPLFAATRQAIADLSDADRPLLHIRDLIAIPARAYLDVPNPPPPRP